VDETMSVKQGPPAHHFSLKHGLGKRFKFKVHNCRLVGYTKFSVIEVKTTVQSNVIPITPIRRELKP
jgi:hypothetical protein